MKRIYFSFFQEIMIHLMPSLLRIYSYQGGDMVNLNLKEAGNRIRSLRKSRYRTAKAFAESLGVSERHIHNIESGKNLPSFEILAQIADEFHVTIDFILFDQKKRLLYEENWDALQNTFNSLSPDGRLTLIHIAKELLRLEQSIKGGNSG